VIERANALFDEIRHCVRKGNCWGEKNPTCRKPVVLPCRLQPEVMIVTEQMNLPKEEWKKNPKIIPKEWDSSETLLNNIKMVKEGKRKTGIIPPINRLFNGRFLEDFSADEMSFGKLYWTHFIKCPGKLRSTAFERVSESESDICADTFLSKEIRVLRPKIIVCLGGYASTWVLKRTGYQHRWTDLLWEEIEWVARGKKQIPEREIAEINHRAKIVVLPHPSGINPLASLLNQKLRYLLF